MNSLLLRTAAGILSVAIGIASGVFAGQSAATPAVTRRWEAVSVRATKDCGLPGPGGPKGAALKNGAPANPLPSASPDRLSMCGTVMNFITTAYILPLAKPLQSSPGGLKLIPAIPIEGAPAWASSELFQITAKAEGTPGRDMLTGPMLQALLADRFKLKIHHDTPERPAYALTIAKGGPKLQPSTCTPPPFPFQQPKPGENTCPTDGAERKGTLLKVHRYAKTIGEFTETFLLDRPVVDRTGIAGIFDFELEFAPDDATPMFLSRLQQLPDDAPAGAPDPSGGPSIFTAIQEQLGLKLEPAKAPTDVFVIDNVERPSPN